MPNHKTITGVLLLMLVAGAGVIMTSCSQNAEGTNANTATAQVVPSQTPVPTSSSVPTVAATPTAIAVTPTASPTVAACKPTVQVTDVTVPDGSRFKPSQTFTKVWRFLNSGDCAWEKGWMLVFQNGERFGAPGSVPMDTVDVGRSVEVSMTMKAPQSPGTYSGFWVLQPPSGQAITVTDVIVAVFIPTPTRAPTPIAPVAKPTAQTAGGNIPPVGSGAFSANPYAEGPHNCTRISETDWIADFYVIVYGGPGNYTISAPENCHWDFALQRFVCRYVSRFSGAVNEAVFVSCPGCKPQKVGMYGRATMTLGSRVRRTAVGTCPVHPGPWGLPEKED